MVIFHSYVSLPEGKPPFSIIFHHFPMVFLWFFVNVYQAGYLSSRENLWSMMAAEDMSIPLFQTLWLLFIGNTASS